MGQVNVEIQIPDKLAPVFDGPARYRGAYGGRGSGKSTTFARKLIERALVKRTRVLCTREFQSSIKDSVIQLLIDSVEEMGVQQFFDYGESFFRCKLWNEEFLFKGLRRNIKEIKSLEGVDICWIEEAEQTSEESFRVLIPTIRAPGSEIWLTWNPEAEDAPVRQRFVLPTPDKMTKVVECNYVDNPWFPPELDYERRQDQKRDPDLYAHVWMGQCLTRTDAQVLAGKWRIDSFTMPEEIDGGPYYGADWGFSTDPMAIVRCWIKGNRLYIDYEAGAVGIEIKDTPAEFDKVPGIRDHVVRADNSRPELISHMAGEKFKIVGVDKWPGSVEDGVTHLRSYDEIVIHERCVNVAREARLWSYKIDKQTGDVLPVLLDRMNHCFIGSTLVSTNKGPVEISKIKIGDMVLTRFGYRRVTRVFDNGLKAVRKFKFPNGKSLTGTDTHEIITIDGKKYIKDISPRDTIFFQRGDSCRLFRARKTRKSYLMAFLIDAIRQVKEEVIGSISGVLAVQPLEEKPNTSTLPFGKKRTVQFPKGLRSIIQTITLSITTLPTWISGEGKRTGRITENTTTQTIRAKREIISTGSGTLPLNGTAVEKAGNGIANTLKTLSRILSQKISCVSSAERSIPGLFLSGLQSFVPMLVRQSIAGSQGWTTRPGFAFIAENNSQQTNTQTQKPVREDAPNNIARVYDISVEDHHEYFANGILVSNCMDALRYALAPIIKRRTFKGKAVYAGSFNHRIHVSLDELLPLKQGQVIVGVSASSSRIAAAMLQLTTAGQVRVLDELVSTDAGVRQFAKSVLRPMLIRKYKGRSVSIVSFNSRSAGGGNRDTDQRALLDEIAEAGLPVDSVSSDALTRRTEAVRYFLGQMAGARPAFSISPHCLSVIDGFVGGYQFKRLPLQDMDEIRYSTDPEENEYAEIHEAVQYACLFLREAMGIDEQQIAIEPRVYA